MKRLVPIALAALAPQAVLAVTERGVAP